MPLFAQYGPAQKNHCRDNGKRDHIAQNRTGANITGCGGDLYYYEMDIGTAGYNNGSSITRGACRIVYTRKDLDGDGAPDNAAAVDAAAPTINKKEAALLRKCTCKMKVDTQK